MLVSKSKLADIKERAECLELMEMCLLKYVKTRDIKWKESAIEFGALSQTWKERIETHDYSGEDRWLEKFDKIIGTTP